MPKALLTLALTAGLNACSDCPDPFELREHWLFVPGQRVVLTAPDGELVVLGRERARTIELEARGCSGGHDARVEVDTSGGERALRVVAERADVRVVLPAAAELVVRHGAGDAELRAVGPTTLVQRAGDAHIEQAIGSVRVAAGAGRLYVRSVIGDVEVVDGPGAIFVESVVGNVRIRDGAGGIHAREIEGDMVVERDEGGSIDVRDIAGDFTVHEKSVDLRLVRHDHVVGRVRLPD